MDEQLVAFLRQLIDTRNNQLQRLVPEVSAAAQSCVNTLTSDSRILCWGNLDCYLIASLLQRQLLHHYCIERPSLPCMLLNENQPQAVKELKALGRPGDLLLVFSTSQESESPRQMLQCARERSLKWLTIGDVPLHEAGTSYPEVGDNLAIYLDVSHKAQLLDSQMAIALSLAGLIDHLLFGSDL